MGASGNQTRAGRRAALGAFARVGAALTFANFAGASVIFVYLAWISPTSDPALNTPRANWLFPVAFAGYMTMTLVAGSFLSRRVLRPVTTWLREERPPTERERRATLAQPFRQARATSLFWVLAALFFAGLNAWVGARYVYVGRAFFTTLSGGLTVFAMSYLLVQAALRSVVAKALAGAPPQRQTGLGIFWRQLFAWLLGSGVPLVGIGLSHVARTPEERAQLATPTWFLVGVGMFSGFLALLVTARSVSRPITAARRALAEIQRGNLDVELVVDEGGEVGELQAGVNALAHGLRERRVLQDLFGRYVGEEVARAAVHRGVALGGERLPASALFVDVIGSTRIAEQLDAEQVVEILNVLFETTVRTVTTHGGWVNKFDGDGALAVFGPPGGLTDHAGAALGAARQLRAELLALTDRYPALDAGIGVSAGTVIAGTVGSEQRFEYTVIGDPVNEAARLTDLAKQRPARVLASEAAIDAAGEEAKHWVPAGTELLRGRTKPTATYEPATVS